MSNIIKGQRVRSESILNINQLVKPNAPKNKGKGLNSLKQEIKADSYYEMEQSRLKAEQEAAIIIGQATAQAEQIITEAKIKTEKEFALALEKAKKEGYAAGYEEGKQASQLLIDEGHKMIEEAKIKKETMLKQLEPEIIEMILAICQTLVGEEIAFNQSIIRLLIRKTLGRMQYEMSDLHIKVAPEQYEFVLENKELIIQDYANPLDVKILQDADLSKGACIIETPFGSVECNIDVQFNEIKRQMRLLSNKE